MNFNTSSAITGFVVVVVMVVCINTLAFKK
jgi:hypothetical protein